MNSTRKIAQCLGIGLLAAGSPVIPVPVALAQGFVLEEVVVTARRRE